MNPTRRALQDEGRKGPLRFGLLLIVAVLVLAFPGSVAGAEPASAFPEVPMDASGFERPAPIDKSFYLTGPASGSRRVVAVFLQLENLPLGMRRNRRSCSDLTGFLPTPDPKQFEVLATSPGESRASFVWPGLDPEATTPDAAVKGEDRQRLDRRRRRTRRGVYPDNPTLVTTAWQRAADSDTAFKILVPATGFFRPNARYCTFVYHETTRRVLDETKRATIASYLAETRACQTNASTCLAEAPSETEPQACRSNYATCMDDARGNVTDDALLAAAKLREYTIPALPELSAPTDVTDPWPLAELPSVLGAVLLEELRERGSARTVLTGAGEEDQVFDPNLDNGTGVPKGGFRKVCRIGVQPRVTDSTLWVVAEPCMVAPPGPPLQRLEIVAAKDIQLPGPPNTLTLEELLRLERREVLDDKEFIDVGEAIQRANQYPAKAKALHEKVEQFHDFFVHLRFVTGTTPHVSALKGWQQTHHPNIGCSTDASGAEPCPNSDWITDTEVYLRNVDGVHEVKRNFEEWLETDQIVVDDYGVIPLLDSDGGSLHVDTWFTQYITPTVGYAIFPVESARNEYVATPYLGFQLFFWPNPVDKPMWRDGRRDWKRIFAFEVGVRPTSLRFGPGDRYGAPPPVQVPVLIGVALQLIPYTTVSLGSALLGARSSGISGERTHFLNTFYVSFSIQGNLFDSIRAIVTKRGATLAK